MFSLPPSTAARGVLLLVTTREKGNVSDARHRIVRTVGQNGVRRTQAGVAQPGVSNAEKISIRSRITAITAESTGLRALITALTNRLPAAASAAGMRELRLRSSEFDAAVAGLLRNEAVFTTMLGREGWLLEIHQEIAEIVKTCASSRMSNQQSRALVFDGTNGVGKTFGALKLAVDMPDDLSDLAGRVGIPLKDSRRKYDIEAVYIGFNINAGLSDAERAPLRRSTDKETAMKQVLYTRLCLAAAKRFDTDADKERYGIVRDLEFSENDLTLAEDQLGSVPQFLVEKCGVHARSRPLALVVIVDEGQLLDLEIPPGDGTLDADGARLALRVLRQLQQSLLGSGLTIVPLMLGTNPETVVSDKTRGTNRVVGRFESSANMAFERFNDLVQQQFKDRARNKNSWNAELLRVVSALVFPRVRDVVDARDVADISLVVNDTALTAPQADELMAAALLNEVPAKEIPVALNKKASKTSDEMRLIDLDFCGWYLLTTKMRSHRSGPIWSTATPTVFDFVKEMSGGHDFEFSAFSTLAHIFVLLFADPSQPGTKTREALLQLAEGKAPWLPRQTAPARDGQIVSKRHDNKRHYYPFDGLGSHARAAAGPLEAGILEEIGSCMSSGQWFFLHGGGDAPIDFLLLYLNEQGEWRVWMCDAKHAQLDRSGHNVSFKHMKEKAQLVFDGLKREIHKHVGKTIHFDVDKDFWIFASQQPPGGTEPYIGPRTFGIEPWPRYLFRDAALHHGRDSTTPPPQDLA